VKPSLLAKLAQQGADWFKVAIEAAQGPGLEGQLDASWPAHLTFQNHSFGAAAQYWQALHVREAALAKGQGYAEEITRVKAAQAEATAAMAVAAAHSMGAQQTSSVTDLQTKLASMLTTALADNRTIYLEVEPDLDTLPPVKGASPVKPTPPSLDLPVGAGEPLLATLLPVAAMRALEATREKLATSASVVEAEAKQVSGMSIASIGSWVYELVRLGMAGYCSHMRVFHTCFKKRKSPRRLGRQGCASSAGCGGAPGLHRSPRRRRRLSRNRMAASGGGASRRWGVGARAEGGGTRPRRGPGR